VGIQHILLVEDNYGDAKLFVDVIKDSKMQWTVHVAVDGVDAMDFLLRQKKHVAAPRPSLILLDLNLPKKDGRQVLKEIKEHPQLRQIPVLILTSSTAEEDVSSSYDNHANGYLVKPMNLVDMSVKLRRIEEFWFQEIKFAEERQFAPFRKLYDKEVDKHRNEERTSTSH
jgi:two-component system, chemotaxis family, response regulator Rcp1